MREGDVKKLENSTLSFVLFQVRFSALERMDHYVPNIQDLIRKKGFPRNKSRDISELIFSDPPQKITHRQWQFNDLENTHAIILDKGFITLQTTCYDVFDAFLTQLCDALDVVNQVVDGIIVERVGLRYINTFTTPEDEDWKPYLREGIRGVQSDLFKRSSALEVHQTTAFTEAGTLAMRLLQNRSGQFLPPDLEFHGLSWPDHLQDVSKASLCTIIDVDHINEDSFPYDRARLEKSAWQLKNTTHAITFHEIFTEHAVNQWK